MRNSRWKVASGDADFAPYLAGLPAASASGLDEEFGRRLREARAIGDGAHLRSSAAASSGTR
jgi:hypothetical protein